MDMHLAVAGGKCACGIREDRLPRDAVTTYAHAVTCRLCRSVLAGHGRVTEPCPVQHGGTVCQGQRGIEVGEGPDAGRFRITCNRCGYSAPWRDTVDYAVSTWDALAGMLRQDYDLRNAVQRFFTVSLTRKEWGDLRGNILDLLGVTPAARRAGHGKVSDGPASESVGQGGGPVPKPLGGDTVDAVARDSIARLATRMDNLDADVARYFADLRKDLRKDLDNGLLSTNSRVVGHMDGLRARMTALGADLRRENEQQFKELRAGTNEALGVLGDRIRALSARMDGVEDGVVLAAKALPRSCVKCGAINNGFSSPAAELCKVCAED